MRKSPCRLLLAKEGFRKVCHLQIIVLKNIFTLLSMAISSM